MRFRSVFFLLLVMSFQRTALLGDDAIVSRLRLEYPAAAARIEGVYSDCRIVADRNVVLREKPEDVKSTYHFEFFRNGKLMKLVGDFTYVKDRSSPEVTRASLLTPTEGFLLNRFPGTDRYVISSSLTHDESLRGLMVSFAPAFVPFCIVATPFKELLSDPRFVISEAEEVFGNDRVPRIRIQWALEGARNGARESGWVTLLPSQMWVIEEYAQTLRSVEGPGERTARARMTYGEAVDGVPIVQAVSTWKERPAQASGNEEYVYKNIRFFPTGPATSEFALPAFGISKGGGDTSRTMYWVVLNALFVMAVILAIVFRRLAARKAMQVGPS